MSIRCRLRLHAWTNPVQVRDDSMVTATGRFGVIAAYRYRYTCRRCGQDSDEFYGYRTTLEPAERGPDDA